MRQKLFKILIGLLLISIGLFMYDTITRSQYSSDNIKQLAATLNLVNGNGYTTIVSDSECGNNQFAFFSSFPIGYSLLSAAYLFVNSNIYYLHTFFSIIAFILIGIYTFKISKLLFSELLFSVLMVLLVLTSCIKGTVVDKVTLTFFLSSIYYLSKHKSQYHYLSISLLFFTCLLRYAYYPQLVVLPVAILLVNYCRNNKISLNRQFIISILGLGSLFILYFIFLKMNSSASDRINDIDKSGVHWNFENVLHFRPVFLDYFVDTYKLYRAFGFQYTGYDRGFVIPLYIRVFVSLISILIFITSHFYLFEKIRKAQKDNVKLILSFLFFSSVINLVFIFLLSFYYESRHLMYIWTWAMIPRYFMINYFVFSVILVLFINDKIRGYKFILAFSLFFVVLNIVDKIRLDLTIYSSNSSKNIDIMYPNVGIHDLIKFYNSFENKRGQYCVYQFGSKMDPSKVTWLNHYASLMNFPVYDLDSVKINLKETVPVILSSDTVFLHKSGIDY